MALEATADQRDGSAHARGRSEEAIEQLHFEAALAEERQETRLFRQLEDAVAMSMQRLERMLSAPACRPETLIGQVRATYSARAGRLDAGRRFSTMGEEPDAMSLRAQRASVGTRRDEPAPHRGRAGLPFSVPVRGTYRNTSGFGYRNDPFNGSPGGFTPASIFARRAAAPISWPAATGRLVFAVRQSGYGPDGRGPTTASASPPRYAHMTRLAVSEGERVLARGTRFRDMGCTGRCYPDQSALRRLRRKTATR